MVQSTQEGEVMNLPSSVGDGSFEHPRRSVHSIECAFEWYDKKTRELTEENEALRAQIEKLQKLADIRWQRSEYPHPEFPSDMRKMQPLPDVLWLKFIGREVVGWSKDQPK
jgi:hypothetical protein